VKNYLNWSCTAACGQRWLYSVIKVLSAISTADIIRKIDDCANKEY
jgi:hypothetical protein